MSEKERATATPPPPQNTDAAAETQQAHQNNENNATSVQEASQLSPSNEGENSAGGCGEEASKPEVAPAAEARAEEEAPAPFTPRSILRRSSTVAAEGGADGAASAPTSEKKRAHIDLMSNSFMADVFYEPTISHRGSRYVMRTTSDGDAAEAAAAEAEAGGEACGEEAGPPMDTHSRLYLDALRLTEDQEARRAAKAKEEEAKAAKQCTFDPLTTRKKGKNGKENSKVPPYNSFKDFIEIQRKWLEDAPKRIAKLVQQHKDIEEGKRDAKGEMGKTTKALIDRMQKEKRYAGPVKGWDDRFNDFIVRKSGDAVLQEMMNGTSPTREEFGERSRKKNAALENSVYSFSPVISAYAAARAARERGERQQRNHSPFRQEWEEDPAGYAARTDVPFRATRASDSVFEKLYKDSAVRSAATRILAESYVENELSTLFKPKTNENERWQFSTARSQRGKDDNDLTVVSQTDDFIEYANGSYAFNGEHYAEDGTHLGPAPPSTADANGAENTAELGNNNSTSLLSIQRTPSEVVDTLLAKGDDYKARRERRRQMLAEQQQQFSFKPQTNKRSHKILADYAKRAEEELTNELARQTLAQLNGESHQLDAPDSLPEGVTGIPKPKKAAVFNLKEWTMRNERAAALKRAKLSQLAEQRDYEELGECTFRPALAANSLRGFSPSGAQRRHNIYSPGSVASCYSASNPPSIPPSSRSRTPNASSVTPSSPLDTRHKYVSRSEHAQGPLLSSSSTTSSFRNGRTSSSDGGNTVGTQQQQRYRDPTTAFPSSAMNASAANNSSYQIPIATVEPTQRRPSYNPLAGRRASLGNVSATDSQLHDHHEDDDELLGGMGGGGGHGAGVGDDVNQYLDDIENEMKGVLADWRNAARGASASVGRK